MNSGVENELVLDPAVFFPSRVCIRRIPQPRPLQLSGQDLPVQRRINIAAADDQANILS